MVNRGTTASSSNVVAELPVVADATIVDSSAAGAKVDVTDYLQRGCEHGSRG